MAAGHWRLSPGGGAESIGIESLRAPQAFRLLQADERAVLLDVRSSAEWDFVGVPLVDRYVQVEWRVYPEMTVNPDFIAEVQAAGIGPDDRLLLLCRSGNRSREAALFLLENGYADVYNISDGFEGVPNDYGHRRTVNGWVAAGLPWLQC